MLLQTHHSPARRCCLCSHFGRYIRTTVAHSGSWSCSQILCGCHTDMLDPLWRTQHECLVDHRNTKALFVDLCLRVVKPKSSQTFDSDEGLCGVQGLTLNMLLHQSRWFQCNLDFLQRLYCNQGVRQTQVCITYCTLLRVHQSCHHSHRQCHISSFVGCSVRCHT